MVLGLVVEGKAPIETDGSDETSPDDEKNGLTFIVDETPKVEAVRNEPCVFGVATAETAVDKDEEPRERKESTDEAPSNVNEDETADESFDLAALSDEGVAVMTPDVEVGLLPVETPALVSSDLKPLRRLLPPAPTDIEMPNSFAELPRVELLAVELPPAVASELEMPKILAELPDAVLDLAGIVASVGEDALDEVADKDLRLVWVAEADAVVRAGEADGKVW